MDSYEFTPLSDYREYPADEMKLRAESFYREMKRRRTVRDYSDRPVPREIIENCLLTAGTAPSGANMQPWHFVAVGDPDTKARIREAAEEVEHDFYSRRAPQYWLDALAPLGTDEHKPYLTQAPWLIAIFSRRHTIDPDGTIHKHYYIAESVGIATGMLVAAIHHAGLACLTHTPNPMGFLRDALERPKEETPYLLLTVGYPRETARVPKIGKRSLEEIATFIV